jgi:serine/threonine protein kinase
MGMIHRDIKPGNILFDLEENAYITDFGLVKLAEASMQLSHSEFFGTPAYTSPRADLLICYSLWPGMARQDRVGHFRGSVRHGAASLGVAWEIHYPLSRSYSPTLLSEIAQFEDREKSHGRLFRLGKTFRLR